VREVEVKYQVADLESLLLVLESRGVELSAPVVQDDQAYAPAGWAYGDARDGVPFARLRTSQGRHVFTVKRPAENVMSCEEYETPVADRDQMHAAVVAMGFWPTVRIRKVRRTALVGDVALCVDEVDGVGVFLEAERLVSDSVPGEIVQAGLAEFVESLGIEAEPVEETYDTLVRAAMAPA
jgi:adenylate cyclase class 2